MGVVHSIFLVKKSTFFVEGFTSSFVALYRMGDLVKSWDGKEAEGPDAENSPRGPGCDISEMAFYESILRAF